MTKTVKPEIVCMFDVIRLDFGAFNVTMKSAGARELADELYNAAEHADRFDDTDEKEAECKEERLSSGSKAGKARKKGAGKNKARNKSNH